ncbi:MAG: hypothetical protein P4L16_04820 [Chlamydiales bacterium]|nr:hypothetical protein [Chlamydiales bacterium]
MEISSIQNSLPANVASTKKTPSDLDVFLCLLESQGLCQKSRIEELRHAFQKLHETTLKTDRVANNYFTQSIFTAVTGALSATLTICGGVTPFFKGDEARLKGITQIFTALSNICEAAGRTAQSAQEGDRVKLQQAATLAEKVHAASEEVLRSLKQLEQGNTSAIDNLLRTMAELARLANQ